MRRSVLAFLGGILWAMSGAIDAAPLVLFTGEATETRDLYQIDLANMSIQPVLKTGDNEEMAAVSPDGKTLCFVSDRQGAMSLYRLSFPVDQATGTDISGGMGAYSFPAWSPDGKTIAVSYAPDPEARLFKRKLVLLDPETRTQKVLLDSVTWTKADGVEVVLDRPLWIDDKTLVFVAIEYADPADAPRIVSSTLYRLTLPDGKPERLVGGESYFDASGSSKGFSASLPTRHRAGVAFSAIEGRFRRTPMTTTLDGLKKQVIPLKDANYFGPYLEIGNACIYGIQDEEGRLKLMYQADEKQKPVPIPFAGDSYEPVLMP
ncbi:MAG TPA: hypothetical protein PKO06_00510 [Candidatus Ozemobacteraceae bacterium]|nr:hypothetical protein [Candidatus Ozemobacteraceae bacterium]